jgi:plasmid replication initiation protein
MGQLNVIADRHLEDCSVLMKKTDKTDNIEAEGRMTTSKLAQERKRSSKPTKMLEERRVHEGDDLLDLFPLPRYFQVHFQHVHENAKDIQAQMIQLREYVTQVDVKLDRLTALLNTLSCKRQDE